MIDKQRFQRIADKKVMSEARRENIQHICQKCNVPSGFRWDYSVEKSTKTCFECGHVDLVIGKDEQVFV